MFITVVLNAAKLSEPFAENVAESPEKHLLGGVSSRGKWHLARRGDRTT